MPSTVIINIIMPGETITLKISFGYIGTVLGSKSTSPQSKKVYKISTGADIELN